MKGTFYLEDKRQRAEKLKSTFWLLPFAFRLPDSRTEVGKVGSIDSKI
jgi:hypothetical protein